MLSIKTQGKPRYVVERKEGEPLVYEDVAKLKEDYKQDIVSRPNTKPPFVQHGNV